MLHKGLEILWGRQGAGAEALAEVRKLEAEVLRGSEEYRWAQSAKGQ